MSRSAKRIAGLPIWLLVLAALLSGRATAQQERWLAIAASGERLGPVLTTQRGLGPEAQIIVSDDCVNLRPGLFIAATVVAPNRAEAVAGADLLKARGFADAYPRACTVKPLSRLDVGIPAVHPSIRDVPATVVNWTDGDRLSQVDSLGDGWLAIRLRRYEAKPEDSREGRRQDVAVMEARTRSFRLLQRDCSDADVVRKRLLIALSCATAVAGDHLFHSTWVYDLASGAVIASRERCRAPRFDGEELPVCLGENVGPDGKLALKPQRMARE